jgi:hypothetical protein
MRLARHLFDKPASVAHALNGPCASCSWRVAYNTVLAFLAPRRIVQKDISRVGQRRIFHLQLSKRILKPSIQACTMVE